MNPALIPVLFNDQIPQEWKAYKGYTGLQGGTISNEKFAIDYIKLLKKLGVYSNTRVLWTGDMGRIIDPNTPGDTYTTLYSADVNRNNLVQATKANQPLRIGQVQQISEGMYNGNGSGRFMTHPAISFGASDPWSLVMNINPNFSSQNVIPIVANNQSGKNIIAIKVTTNRIDVYGETTSSNSIVATSELSGKNTTLSITYSGTQIKVYFNETLKNTVNLNTGITFSRIFEYIGNYFTGQINVYRLQSGVMSASQVASEAAFLTARFPEIPSVQIGTQTWAVQNFNAVCTPMGNLISNITENTAVEKITQPINLLSGWNALSSVINDGNTFTTSAGAGGVNPSTAILSANKWIKVVYSGVVSAGNTEVYQGTSSGTRISISGLLSGTFSLTKYYKVSSTTELNVYLRNDSSATTDITTFSITELGWANSTEIYDAVYAATSGDAATKTTAALKEAAMWCAYNNDLNNEAIYGKLYNQYAVDLLTADIAAYNAANPTKPFGWHVPSLAEWTTLVNYLGGSDVAGGKLKQIGTTNWSSPNTGATNESGFYALPGGFRRQDTGLFNSFLSQFTMWFTTNSRYGYINYNSAVAFDTSIAKPRGCSIRLIKDS